MREAAGSVVLLPEQIQQGSRRVAILLGHFFVDLLVEFAAQFGVTSQRTGECFARGAFIWLAGKFGELTRTPGRDRHADQQFVGIETREVWVITDGEVGEKIEPIGFDAVVTGCADVQIVKLKIETVVLAIDLPIADELLVPPGVGPAVHLILVTGQSRDGTGCLFDLRDVDETLVSVETGTAWSATIRTFG